MSINSLFSFICLLYLIYLFVYKFTIMIIFVSPNEAGYKGEDGLSFRLLSKTKSFRVRAKTTEERDVWIKDISKIAR